MNIFTKKLQLKYVVLGLVLGILIFFYFSSCLSIKLKGACFGKRYYGPAHEAERITAVQSVALMVKIDSSDIKDNSKYIMTSQSMLDLFKKNDFRGVKERKGICYFYVADAGKNLNSGDDNEFFFTVWGEKKSTDDHKNAGFIYDGSENSTDLRNSTNLKKEDLLCKNIEKTSQRIKAQLGQNASVLYFKDKVILEAK